MTSLGEPREVPHIDPNDPSSKFGPDSHIDYGAYSPAKYPGKKKKAARKKLKLDIPKREEGKLQYTLDRWLFKTRSRVRFKKRVLLKEITPDSVRWTTVPLRGFSEPWSAFSRKRQQVKSEMKRNDYW